MKWIHIDFFFGYVFSDDDRFMFDDLIRRIIKQTRWIVRRKFYLYEPQPNCFLALEIRSVIFIPYIRFLCAIAQREYLFIKYMGVHTTAGRDENDKNNGEGFLNIMNAMTEWYLFDKYNHNTKLWHILHCCLEFQTGSRKKEVYIYKQMLKGYDPNFKDYGDVLYGLERGDTKSKKHKIL